MTDQMDVAAVNPVFRALLRAREQGDMAGALLDLRQIATGGSEDAVGATFHLGLLLHETGDVQGAEEAFRYVVYDGDGESRGEAAIRLAFLLTERHDLAGAVQAYRIAADLDDLPELDEQHRSDVDLLGAGALEAARQFITDDASTAEACAYEQAMDTGHPVYASEAAAQLAAMYRRQGRANGPQTAIDALIAKGRSALVSRAWFRYGHQLATEGDLESVDQLWARLSTTIGGPGLLAMECGRHVLHGRTTAAEVTFHQVIAAAPDLAEQLGSFAMEVGSVRERRGNHPAARTAYEITATFGTAAAIDWLVEDAEWAIGQL
ncbi:hypothetical protein OG474_26505 [Kribbella sp. NBC_01505]|uniref:hypothetical protein n=1 Tax=Kribbella sp. NBC_01505 TaxID=2903580 RepID=UPI003870D4D9